MPAMLDIELIKQEKTKALQAIAEELLSVAPIDHHCFQFNTKDIVLNTRPDDFLRSASEWIGIDEHLYIYFFELFGSPDLDSVMQQFDEAKTNKVGDRAYPRRNKELSSYLYIGSSKDVIKRLKEHLGYGSASTYAIQFAYWATSLSLDIGFCCMRFDSSVSKEVLQAMEDAIFEFCRPMLGRMGAR